MHIKYDDGVYTISFPEGRLMSTRADNIIKCKQIFLKMMSMGFDKAVNRQLGDYGFEDVENEKYI